MRISLCVLFIIFATASFGNAQPIFKSPELAAKTLFGAWQTGSKAKAMSATSDETMEKLFSVRWRKMTFKGCSKREEGDFECIYEDRKNDITLAMLTTRVTRRGYRIRSVSFSSEAI